MRGFFAALVVAGALAGCTAAQTKPPLGAASPAAAAGSGCNAAPDASRQQYIIGYGSLMQDESRARTSPRAGAAHPIELAGYRRGWFSRGSSVGFSTTFLGVVQDASSHLNAVIYPVDASEVLATDERERSYCRAAVPSSQVKPLGPPFSFSADAQSWIYVSRGGSISLPSAKYPIVQSYVDIFVSGCLDQESRYGVAGFAEQCIETTSGWSEHWVNDRIYPRRPFIYQPKAREIDRLLAKELPAVFGRIRIEP